jgi:hypothetical protein
VFDNFRQSLQDLFGRGVSPEDRRSMLAHMRETLVQAKAGVNDLRDGLQQSRRRLEAERRELETVQRRRALAEGIGDAETIAVATRFQQHHAERVAVLEEKVRVQESELALVEREVEEMTQALKSAMAGVPPAGVATGRMTGGPAAGAPGGDRFDEAARREVEEVLGGDSTSDDIEALRRQQARADRESEAARRLDELKRRMGQ